MLLHYEAVTQTRVSRAGYHHGDLPNALADAATDLARSGGPEAVVLAYESGLIAPGTSA